MQLADRRRWMAHCSALLLAAAGGGANANNKPTAAKRERRVLVVGDSMSAEYGLPRGSGWVALMEKQLAALKPPVRVVNASVSGDTSAGGRSRLPALLAQHQPSHVVLELGGNDALRGLSLAATRENLAAMARAVREAGAKLVVVGMQVPPNYGRQYTQDFAALFVSVAREHQAELVPFLLAGVADGPEPEKLFQADRIHPNAQAQAAMLANVWPALQKSLR